MSSLSENDLLQLRSALQDAIVKCSERCLYQSAKWAAELLDAIPELPVDQRSDLSEEEAAQLFIPTSFTANVDPREALLETKEVNRYLLAKSFFDCREFDRCAAVFVPDSILLGIVDQPVESTAKGPSSDNGKEAQTNTISREIGSHRTAKLHVNTNQRGTNTTANSTTTTSTTTSTAGPQTRKSTRGKGISSNNQQKLTGKQTQAGQDPTEPSPPPQPQQHAAKLPKISQRSLFLALYAKVLAGEKTKNEELEMVMGPQDRGNVINPNLLMVSRYLHTWFAERRLEDDDEYEGSQGWLEYLYGMVLAKEKNEEKAMEFFLRSVHLFPMNWGCWLEMASLISRVEELNRIAKLLPQNIVSYMFHVFTSLELYQRGGHIENSLNQLLSIFPTSSFLLTCHAMLAYHSKDLIVAEKHFSRLLSLHPHRLDSLDHYSNILYVMSLRPKLAFLAHLCSTVDKFRPESCVVIGNYFSLISQHEKAVQYFRRALTLDRSCLSAWTLMGHEYVELKNTHAAIESYRRAVDVNRRDYRAWYGLGQTYEMLDMHTYSLWYYKKAAGLRPWDAKMWMAVGSSLQKMERYQDGIKALKRALLADAYADAGLSNELSGQGVLVGQLDPEILLQIATMYEQLQEVEEAVSYMELCVAQEVGGAAAAAASASTTLASSTKTSSSRKTPSKSKRSVDPDSTNVDESGLADSHDFGNSSQFMSSPSTEEALVDCGEGGGTGVTAATSKARMWLARYSLTMGDYVNANRLATELCHDGVEVEEAKALVQEAQAHLDINPMVR